MQSDFTSQLTEQSEERKSAELSRTYAEFKNLEMSAESNATVVSKLWETTECPVCLELPRSTPIYVCTNGHIVCNRYEAFFFVLHANRVI